MLWCHTRLSRWSSRPGFLSFWPGLDTTEAGTGVNAGHARDVLDERRFDESAEDAESVPARLGVDRRAHAKIAERDWHARAPSPDAKDDAWRSACTAVCWALCSPCRAAPS